MAVSDLQVQETCTWVQERCTKQLVQIVIRKLKYPSNHPATDRYTAENATRIIDQRDIKQKRALIYQYRCPQPFLLIYSVKSEVSFSYFPFLLSINRRKIPITNAASTCIAKPVPAPMAHGIINDAG